MYSLQGLDFWNYDLTPELICIFLMCMVAMILSAYLFDEIRNKKQEMGKKTRIAYIVCLVISIACFIYYFVELAQIPEPQRKDQVQNNTSTSIVQEQ